MTPVFLLSLPRSGSTLIQRVLACHPDIATTSEPWIQLPAFYALRKKGISAEYEQLRLAQAIEDFYNSLPGGRNDYLAEIREMSQRLYTKAAKGASHFLDKTPRYHLILDELLETFPDAKFIIIWRNPLAIAASMIETWGAGKWNLHWFEIDLYTGLPNLANTYANNKDRIHAIKFEDFVTDPQKHTGDIFQHLGLPNDKNAIDYFSDVNLQGRMGDPTGVKQYKKISAASLDKWKGVLNNPLRKRWARNYLESIDSKILNTMGYELQDLKCDLKDIPASINHLGSDITRMLYGKLYRYQQNKCWSHK